MFALFYSLYVAMFIGTWANYDLPEIKSHIQPMLNDVGQFITSIFGNNQMNTLGDSLFFGTSPNYIYLVSFILALITSIGIVVLSVKGIKRVFSIFFMGIR